MSKKEDKDVIRAILIVAAIFIGIGVLFFHMGTGWWWVVLALLLIVGLMS